MIPVNSDYSEIPHYKLVQVVHPRECYDCAGCLIAKIEEGKYEFFLIPEFSKDCNVNPCFVMNTYPVGELALAQQLFPNYNLSEKNYGFQSDEYPDAN